MYSASLPWSIVWHPQEGDRVVPVPDYLKLIYYIFHNNDSISSASAARLLHCPQDQSRTASPSRFEWRLGTLESQTRVKTTSFRTGRPRHRPMSEVVGQFEDVHIPFAVNQVLYILPPRRSNFQLVRRLRPGTVVARLLSVHEPRRGIGARLPLLPAQERIRRLGPRVALRARAAWPRGARAVALAARPLLVVASVGLRLLRIGTRQRAVSARDGSCDRHRVVGEGSGRHTSRYLAR
jgi:hypothetical protein